MPNSDPEHEISNVERPANRDIVSPHPNAREQQVKDAKDSQGSDGAGNGNRDKPPTRRLALRTAGSGIGDPGHRPIVLHQGWARHAFLKRHHLRGRDLRFSHYAFPSLGWLLAGDTAAAGSWDSWFPSCSALIFPILAAPGIFGFGLRSRAR